MDREVATGRKLGRTVVLVDLRRERVPIGRRDALSCGAVEVRASLAAAGPREDEEDQCKDAQSNQPERSDPRVVRSWGPTIQPASATAAPGKLTAPTAAH